MPCPPRWLPDHLIRVPLQGKELKQPCEEDDESCFEKDPVVTERGRENERKKKRMRETERENI